MKDDGTGNPPSGAPASSPATASNPAVPSATLPCGKTSDPLIAELAAKGIKHNPQEIVAIGQKSDGTIVFLEKGNTKAGLQHIIDAHKDDFAKAGVEEKDIPAVVMQAALTETPPVDMQGKKPGRPVHVVDVNGKPTRIAVTTGSNGFIVGANPAGGSTASKPPATAPTAATGNAGAPIAPSSGAASSASPTPGSKPPNSNSQGNSS